MSGSQFTWPIALYPFFIYDIDVATHHHCFVIFSLLVWLPCVHYFYPVCIKRFWPPWLLTVNSKPAETDLGSEMCECIFQFSELTPFQGLAASAGINSGTLSLHADVQVFHKPLFWWTVFAVFVIEHLDLFFSRLCLRKAEQMRYVWVCLKWNLNDSSFLHHWVSSVIKGSRNKLKNPIYETFFQKEWENFYLEKIQHIKYWAACLVYTFFILSPLLFF